MVRILFDYLKSSFKRGDKLSKQIIIGGVTVLLVSIISFTVKLNKINNNETEFLKTMREMDSHMSDEEYEIKRLPKFLELSKHNHKAKYYLRFGIIVLGTVVLLEIKKDKKE